MQEKVLTMNGSEIITAKWDGVRFALIYLDRVRSQEKIIILNPTEITNLQSFLKSCC